MPVLPIPAGETLAEENDRVRATMDDDEVADPANAEDNHAGWLTYFRQSHERGMVAYEGPPPPKRKKSAGLNLWWSVEGRTLPTVLAHIEASNSSPLQYPPRPPASALRRRSSPWLPRRMAVATSLASASVSHSSGLAPAFSPPAHDSPLLRQVKREAPSPPRSTLGTCARDISINEPRAPSPPRGTLRLVYPKKEPGLRVPKKEPGSGGLRVPKKEPGLRMPKKELKTEPDVADPL